MFKRFKNWFNTHRNSIAIVLFIISIIILTTSLITRNVRPAITTLGYVMTTIGMVLTLYDKDSKKRGFEVIKDEFRKNDYVRTPTRSSIGSAGYDFYSPNDYDVEPNEIVKIWTDIKAYMQDDEVLLLNVRSSMGGKFMLANTLGVIDASYYGNPDNDGSIGLFLKNISNETQHISKNDRIGQGIFMKYLIIDNDNTTTKRVGGWGSSGQ